MSFSEWREVKLEDIIEIEMGQSPKSEFYNQTGEGLPFLQGNRTFGDKYPYFDTYCTENKKIANKNDVIMSVRAPVGDLNIAQTQISLGRGVCAMRLKGEQNSNYLFYLMKHNIKEMINRESGTVFGSVNKKDILGLDVKITNNKLEQKAIAHILSTLDDKIEVNNQINKTLENMAQAIFKQWFVDFEFPNEDGEPYKSSGGEMIESELGMIPKGWEVISLDKIVDVKSGYSYKGTDLSESNNAMVTIKNFDRNGGYKKDGLKEIIISDRVKKHHYIEINDVVVAHTDLTQGAEIIGNPVMVLSKGKYEKLIMSMDVVKVISKDNDIDNAFIYCLLKTDNFKQYALGYVNGTTVLHLSKKAIPQYKLPFPTDIKICKELSAILKTIMMKISLSDNENDNLNLTRDILLPKLMSGEIRVPLDEEGDVS